MCTDDEARDRAKRLYQFLGELIRLRQIPVRSIDSYEIVTPLRDLPPAPDVRFAARLGDLKEGEDDAWLEVRCPRIESYPPPPPVLIDWLDPKQLSDATLDIPEILAGSPSADPDGEPESDYDEEGSIGRGVEAVIPEDVRDAWEQYVGSEWWPWAERARPRYRAKRLYDDLFRMYQRQELLAETYEVIVGFGLLAWQPSGSIEIRRHLLTVQASLELDAKRQILTLRGAASGIDLRLEDDMVDPTLRPPSEIRNRIRTELREANPSLWVGGDLLDILREYCYSLAGSDVLFDPSDALPKEGGRTPTVALGRTIILRRRGVEGLAGFVDKIVEAIDTGADIPPAVRQQVCIDDPQPGEAPVPSEARAERDDEIYFPLPANREQRRIVERLDSANGIVVQGPPGTGKSQTIANLVCHLLATGKRVLVTSHTARALQVLRDKLPEPIAPLCVQALSNDRKGMDALEFSVKGITDQHQTWDPVIADASITAMQKQLATAREQLQKAIYDQRAIREAETFHHDGIAGSYSGTLAQIARRVSAEEPVIGLIPDLLELSDPPCSAGEFQQLCDWLASDAQTVRSDMEDEPPSPNEFIEPERFADLIAELSRAQGELSASSDSQHHVAAGRLSELSPDARLRVRTWLDEIAAPLDDLKTRRSEQWLPVAVRDVFSGRERRWREIHAVTSQRVAVLRSLPAHALDARVAADEQVDAQAVKHSANVLLERLHARRGRGLGLPLLQPSPVRTALSSLASVRVNGIRPADSATLELLAHWAEVSTTLGSLDEEWAGIADAPSGTVRARINEYEDNCRPLEDLFALQARATEARTELERLGLPAPRWHDPVDVQSYRSSLARADALARLGAAGRAYDECANSLLRIAPRLRDGSVRTALLAAVQAQGAACYANIYSQVALDRSIWERANSASAALQRVGAAAAVLAHDVQQDPLCQRWRDLVDWWDAAWAWAAARSWLTTMADPEAEQLASARVTDEQRRINGLLAKLAAKKAWAYCLRADRLTEPRRQALQAWANAVKRIGKGTGKYANMHRRAARDHIGRCQPAIPAWIMPLYRVAESVPVSEQRFDVAIIDEASQSGPEALALLFIADKIVVVGDSKQISPDPFTRVDEVTRLRREFLADIPANDALDPENSLFDLAVIRYPAQVRLVEHFRCMPEIIQFSNNLCYRSEPLLPLRQFGAGRLEPVIQTVHVPTGYVKGKTHKTNPPEAAALARKAAELVRDKRYDGKTFGVISLLGERHARLIESELEGVLGANERNERKLICGDAYEFQGDERDVMFLSLVAAPSLDQPVRALSDPKGRDMRRYNVAVSRAKDQVWLFHSATLNDLSPNDLRYSLLHYCTYPERARETTAGISISELQARARSANRATERQPDPFDSWFEADVFIQIANEGFTIVPQYEVSGYRIDLAVIGRSAKLAVECDGEFWHGPEQWERDAARQRDLERCGWPFVRIRESAFYLDPGSALAPLWEALRRHGIDESTGIADSEDVAADDPGSPPDATLFDDSASLGELPANEDLWPDHPLPEYIGWTSRPVPDPRVASREAVTSTLCEIVEAEGPATWRRVLDLYRIALGLGRLRGPTRESLEAAARLAVRMGRIAESIESKSEHWYCRVVRSVGSEPVVVRDRGPRPLEDVPPSEIAALMRERNLLIDEEEVAFRQILATYGLRRLTDNVTTLLRHARELALQEAGT